MRNGFLLLDLLGPLRNRPIRTDSATGAMKIAQVRRYALSLPEVTEQPHFEYSSFRVRGKIFVAVPDEEHIHFFVGEAQREQALALHSMFVEKLFWGGKVCGIRVRLSGASPSV